jgi:hypothetical protein
VLIIATALERGTEAGSRPCGYLRHVLGKQTLGVEGEASLYPKRLPRRAVSGHPPETRPVLLVFH